MIPSRPHAPRALARARLVLASAVLASATLLAPASAAAQGVGTDPTLAQTLFEEGRRLMEAKAYAQACPKLAESQRLRPGTGTLLNLALCNEALGRTATAWGQFKEALYSSKKEGNAAREAFAQEHINNLEPRLSRIQLNAEVTPGLEIQIDGLVIPEAALGTPIPIDPGSHRIEVKETATKATAWSTAVQIGDSADLKTIAIPKMQPAPPADAGTTTGPEAPATGGGSGAAAGGGATGSGSSGGSGLRTAGFVIGGVGVAVIGTGAVFGILAAGQASDAENDPALCPNKQCTPEGRKEISAAETKALLATIGVGVGVAAVGAGVVLALTSGASRTEGAGSAARRSSPGRVEARVVPLLGPGGGGVGVLGTF